MRKREREKRESEKARRREREKERMCDDGELKKERGGGKERERE